MRTRWLDNLDDENIWDAVHNKQWKVWWLRCGSMANSMDPVLSHHTSQERQPAAVPELPNNQPHQSPKQSHAKDHTGQIEATSEDHHWRTGRLPSRKEHHRVDLQPTNRLWELSLAPARLLPCFHRLQSTGFDMQFCGQPWRRTTSAQTLSKSSKTSITRPQVPSSSTAAQETGSEQQLESDRDVYSHPPSSIYFWKGSWQTP